MLHARRCTSVGGGQRRGRYTGTRRPSADGSSAHTRGGTPRQHLDVFIVIIIVCRADTIATATLSILGTSCHYMCVCVCVVNIFVSLLRSVTSR